MAFLFGVDAAFFVTTMRLKVPSIKPEELPAPSHMEMLFVPNDGTAALAVCATLFRYGIPFTPSNTIPSLLDVLYVMLYGVPSPPLKKKAAA